MDTTVLRSCRVAMLRSEKCVLICVQQESHGVLQLINHRELVYLTLSLLAHVLYNSIQLQLCVQCRQQHAEAVTVCYY
jgi:hypothetical protein